MAADAYNPTELNCDQWLDVISRAGAKYAILVCKHHDGFANWPSKYTEYSVKNTPWLDGKGDVVRLFVDACRKYDIKVGLYYSPAQFGSNDMDGKEYDDYFINQISELLTNYGKIDILVNNAVDRRIIKVPGSDNVVIVYDQNQEDEYMNVKFPRMLAEDGSKYFENTGHELTRWVSCSIPEIGVELHSRCFACRIDENGELQSLEDGDGDAFVKYFPIK